MYKTHNLSNTPVYHTWQNIKSRCYNNRNPAYPNYGGRGITMCDRWRNSFEAFYEDLSKLAHFGENGYTLDRIDNNGNYEPSNCRWATRKEQQYNTRANHYLTFNGKTQTRKQWADELGIGANTLYMRLNKYNWDIERALTTK